MLKLTNLTGFGSGANGSVHVTSDNYQDQQISPTDTYAGYRLNTNGKAQYSEGIAETYVDIAGDWLRAGSASMFEVKATLNSGALFSGTTGSWLALTSTRQWDVKRTSNLAGNDAANLTIEVRRVGSTVTISTATITLSAEVIV